MEIKLTNKEAAKVIREFMRTTILGRMNGKHILCEALRKAIAILETTPDK